MSQRRDLNKTVSSNGDDQDGFSADERAAIRERADELKAEKRKGKTKTDGESDVLAKIAEMEEPDRSMAERLHVLIKTAAPMLTPKTWYGMPAYALEGKVMCFFQSSRKFGTRYCTLGFSDVAHLDDGVLWPTTYALTELTAAAETRIVELIRQAAQIGSGI